MNTELNGVFISHQFIVISIKQYNFLYIVDLKSVIYRSRECLENKPFLPL